MPPTRQEIEGALSLASIAVVALYAVIEGQGLGKQRIELEDVGVVSAEQIYLYTMSVLRPINQANGVHDVSISTD